MLNETVSEFLQAYLNDPPCGCHGCPYEADAHRTLLTRLFGEGVLDYRTASGFGNRIKRAIRAAHEEEAAVES